MFRFSLWLLFAALLAPSAFGASGRVPDCANPREAADSLFVWQTPSQRDLKNASTCLDAPPGASPQRLAVQLEQVLDAKGLWVPISSMSTDPDYTDAEGEPQVVPMPKDAPWLVLARGQDGKWRYTRRTLEEVPGLYGGTFSPLSQWFQAHLPGVFYRQVFGMYLWQVAYAILLVLLAWSAGRLVNWLLKGQVRRWVRRAHLELEEKVYDQLQLPLVALTMAAILSWGVTDLQLRINASWMAHAVLQILIAFSVVLAVSRTVGIIANIAEARAADTESRLDDQVIPLLRQATQVVVWCVGVLFILQNQGIDVAGLLAGLGIGGLAFALAAKDTLANLFGSLNIFVDKPFQIGDAVQIGSVEGAIEEVGFRSTRVRTFYNSLVTIPNSSITNANVDNLGARPRRRVKVTLGVTYDTPPDKLDAFVQGIRKILDEHPAVAPGFEVHFYNFGASALEVLCYYHLVVNTWTAELNGRSETFFAFMRLAEDLGIGFAFPSTSVYLESVPERMLTGPKPETA